MLQDKYDFETSKNRGFFARILSAANLNRNKDIYNITQIIDFEIYF